MDEYDRSLFQRKKKKKEWRCGSSLAKLGFSGCERLFVTAFSHHLQPPPRLLYLDLSVVGALGALV
jgi:hypothetical protein